MLCKYQNCTNPSCQFRHEDADGNPIPPPALTARQNAKHAKDKPAPAATAPAHDANMSDNEDNDFEVVVSGRSLMDGPLEDKKTERPCRFGERCTRGEFAGTYRDSSELTRSRLQVRSPAFEAYAKGCKTGVWQAGQYYERLRHHEQEQEVWSGGHGRRRGAKTARSNCRRVQARDAGVGERTGNEDEDGGHRGGGMIPVESSNRSSSLRFAPIRHKP